MAETVISTFLNIGRLELERAGIRRDALKEEVAVVTGGASNIGLGYARSLAGAGANVVIADINAEAGAEAARVINEENGRDCALFVKTDVTSDEDIKALAAKAFARFGKVDILINNAMNMRLNGKILESPISDLDRSYAISGRGVALAVKEFVPAMLGRKHGIVTYSATQFHYAPPMIGGTVYCAGKAAATSLIMSLANELGPAGETGVSVFCLCPAGVMRFDPSKMPPPPPPEPGEPERPEFDFEALAKMMTTPEQNGAALVFSLLRAEELHGSGLIHIDVFKAMGHPFSESPTVAAEGVPQFRRLSDMDLAMVFCYMGAGFE
ncbi:MAG: SDR family oxidoreductase [Oscillospiraceae bacterium]|jgi:NAD(P)-dependent dehydrogenase (short-subunit alcohol dehydrogenase family)|nr:SDR family oxidoreductase [Oscillospiraceae bacterium]